MELLDMTESDAVQEVFFKIYAPALIKKNQEQFKNNTIMQTPIYIETEKGKYCIGTDGTVRAILDSDNIKLNVVYPHSERYKAVLKSYSEHVAIQQGDETEVVCAYYRESDKSLNLHTEKVNFPMTSVVAYFNCMQKKGVNRGEFLGDIDGMSWKAFLEQRRIPVDIVRIDGKVIKSRRGIEDGSNY